MDELTKEELSVLEEYCAGEIPWKVIEKIPLKKFPEDAAPAALIEFGGTYIAKTAIDGERVWAVVGKRKGKFYYESYGDMLKSLLDWL